MALKYLRTFFVRLAFLFILYASPTTSVYAVTDEEFNHLRHAFEQLHAELGVLTQASYQLPIGSIIAWSGDGGTPLPEGYLPCDGRWVNDSEYPALKNRVSEKFKDVSQADQNPERFQLPNFSGRTLVGVGTDSCENSEKHLGDKFGKEKYTLTEGEMPAHSHNARDRGHSHTAIDKGHAHEDAGHSHGGENFNSVDGHRAEWNSGFASGPAFSNGGAKGVSRNGGASEARANIQTGHAKISVENGRAQVEVDSAGGGQAFNICQPSIAINYLIKAK